MKCLIGLTFFFLSVGETYSQVAAEDSMALVDLFDSTNGQNWIFKTNWKSANPVSTWYGIYDVIDNHVRKILLNDNNLTGYIPHTICRLNYLRYFRIDNNFLSDFPVVNEGLDSLIGIILSNNNHTIFPIGLCGVKNLNTIGIAGNNIQSIPHEISLLKKLTTLDLHQNQLSELTDSVVGLTGLVYINLNQNQFTRFPRVLTRMMNLQTVEIQTNPIHETFPVEITRMNGLETLNMKSTQMFGDLTDSLGYMPGLSWLELDNNQFTGTIPLSLSSLPMWVLSLNDNRFDSLPDFSPPWVSPLAFNVAGNRLTFADIEPNADIGNFSYQNQDSMGDWRDTILYAGDSLTLSALMGGMANEYQWYRHQSLIHGATQSHYRIDSAVVAGGANYYCRITNPVCWKLTLYTRPVYITVLPRISTGEPVGERITECRLNPNYPNPFNPYTVICYSLKSRGKVSLRVYNVLGQEVRRLFSGLQQGGVYRVIWDGKDEQGNDAGSGIYIIRLETGAFVQSRKMTLLR